MQRKTFEHWTVWTGVAELFFLGGVFYGWPAYVFVLKEEEVFYELCNETEIQANLRATQNATNPDDIVKHCVAQDNFFNTLFVVGCAISNMSGLLFGYILDNYGLLACRMVNAVPLTLGLILMIFYQNGTALVIGVELLAFSTIGTLLSNLTLQPIWPTRTSTIGSIFSGTFDGSAATCMLMKVLYDFGIPLSVITSCLAGMSVMHWGRTYFLCPVKIIPRNLPDNYDLRKMTPYGRVKNKTSEKDKEEHVKLASNRDEGETASAAGESNSGGLMKQFFREVASLQFVALAIWYCVVSLRINAFQFWFNPSLQWMFPDQKSVQSELTNIYGLTYIMSLPISPIAGMMVDFFAKRYRESQNNELRGKAYGVAFVCGICSVFGAVISYLSSFQNNFTIAVTSQIIFSVVRTFLYAILAQASFLLFPHELFGLIYGFLQLLNGFTTFLADPIFRYINNSLDGNFAPVHYVLTVTTLITVLYPVVLIQYGRKIPQQ